MDDSPLGPLELLLLLVWVTSVVQLVTAAAQLVYLWRRGVLAGAARRWAGAALAATYAGAAFTLAWLRAVT